MWSWGKGHLLSKKQEVWKGCGESSPLKFSAWVLLPAIWLTKKNLLVCIYKLELSHNLQFVIEADYLVSIETQILSILILHFTKLIVWLIPAALCKHYISVLSLMNYSKWNVLLKEAHRKNILIHLDSGWTTLSPNYSWKGALKAPH